MATKRNIGLLGLTLSLLLLIGCSNKIVKTDSEKIPTTGNTQSKSTSIEKPKDSNAQLFDTLPIEMKIALYTDVVDERVKKSPGLEGFSLTYFKDDNDIYVSLHSAGRVYTIHHLLSTNEGIKPIQVVGYDNGKADSDSTRSQINLPAVSKDELYLQYKERTSDFDNSTAKITENRSIYLNFVDALRNSRVPMENAEGSSAKLTDEELVIAGYIQNHIQLDKSDNISIYINTMLDRISRFNKIEGGYTIEGVQQSVRDEYLFNGDSLVSSQTPENFKYNTEQSTSTLSTDDLNSKYQSYKGMLTLVATYLKVSEELDSKNRSEAINATQQNKDSSQQSTVDTKNLTSEQAINWVKNYLKSNGATDEELDNAGFQAHLSDDEYLIIEMFTWNPAHTSRDIDTRFRIDSDGNLQKTINAMGSEPFETISTTY